MCCHTSFIFVLLCAVLNQLKHTLSILVRDLNDALKQPAKPQYSCINFIIHNACCTGTKVLYITNEVLLPMFHRVASKHHYNESHSVVALNMLLFRAPAITLSYNRVHRSNQSIRHNEGRKFDLPERNLNLRCPLQ